MVINKLLNFNNYVIIIFSNIYIYTQICDNSFVVMCKILY
jgi:hypothetical protein